MLNAIGIAVKIEISQLVLEIAVHLAEFAKIAAAMAMRKEPASCT